MKIEELNFKGSDNTGYSFIRQCLFKDEWQENAAEYNTAIKRLIKASANTDEFVNSYLANSHWKNEQCYLVMLKAYKPEKVWYYIREMFGDKSKKTMSDAGALKIGADNFSILIPNGHGDGETRYAILERKDFYAGSLMNYFTIIDGKFNIYSYDCGDDVCEEINGKFQVYYSQGLIAFVAVTEVAEFDSEYEECWSTGNYEDQMCDFCPHNWECSAY